MTFFEARRQGFSPGTPVFFSPSLVNGPANKINLKEMRFKLYQTQQLTGPFVRRGTRHITRDMCCT